MLSTIFISILTLAFATHSYCLTTDTLFVDVNWDNIPIIPDPQTPAEYDTAVAIFHDAIRNTTLEAVLFGDTPIISPELEVQPMTVLTCQTSAASPMFVDAIIAVGNLKKLDKCNHPAPRLNQCTELVRWGTAAIGRCDAFRQRNNPFACSSAASYIIELMDSGCPRIIDGKAKFGGYASFKFHVGSPYSDINCYHT